MQAEPYSCLDGPGPARATLRAIDWSANPLGSPAGWPVALQVAVQMMLASHFPKAIFWGPRMITLHNDAFAPILGAKPAPQGRPFYDIWAEAWAEIGPIAERAFAGKATFIEDFPLVIDRNGHPEACNFTFCYSPIRDETGRVAGVMDTVIETTGKVAAEHALQVRNAELAHRLKNTLAVVSVIARQTLRSSTDTADAWGRLSARLGALGAAHQILTSGVQLGAPIEPLIRGALAAYDDALVARIGLTGPPVALEAKQALAVALIVNELATNAMKYGSLSQQQGRVEIDWSLASGPEGQSLTFRWAEHGGPPASPPAREGFGTMLTKHVAPQDFGGEAESLYTPEGFRYRLTGPLQS
ncbi:HWE histidine kinase domain-containing protein [Frigidibacter sp. MR17.14]|uniref:sensor histidine kinase n=1 Tax=Frigidibacter sp. MR17.14 TaxID=3126509 RepID=UPI003012DB2D